jgi:hypothetical protein
MNSKSRKQDMGQNFPLFLALVLLPFWVAAAPSLAAETTLEWVMGYDDNVDKQADGDGSGFLEARGYWDAALFPESLEHWDLQFYADGRYAHRFRMDDLGEAGAGFSARHPLFQGRWIPGAALEGRWIRDGYLTEDDRDLLRIRFPVEFLATAATTVGFEAELGWSDYREPVAPGLGGGTNRPPFSASRSLRASEPPAGRGGQGLADGSGAARARSREDDLAAARLWAAFFPRPDARLDVEGLWTRVDSTIERESFDGAGLSAGGRWFPGLWDVGLSLSWFRDDYDAGLSGSGNREDRTWIFRGEIRRRFGPVEGAAAVEWTDLNSSAAGESYRGMVSTCGISWSF